MLLSSPSDNRSSRPLSKIALRIRVSKSDLLPRRAPGPRPLVEFHHRAKLYAIAELQKGQIDKYPVRPAFLFANRAGQEIVSQEIERAIGPAVDTESPKQGAVRGTVRVRLRKAEVASPIAHVLHVDSLSL